MRLVLADKSEYYSILPFFFILCPTFPAILPSGLGEQVIFSLEVFAIIYLGIFHVYKIKFEHNLLFYFCFFLYSIHFSILFDLLRSETVFSDYFELIKPFAFFLFYSFYRYSTVDIDVLERKTIRIILIIFFALSLWSMIEIVFSDYLLNISYWLYRREDVPVLRNKAIGSFAQTYQFAYILLLPLIYSFISLLRRRSLIYLFLFLCFFITILLTQSRSMYVCMFFCLIVCFFIPVLYVTVVSSFKTILLISVIVLSLLILYFIFQDDLKELLSYAFYGFESMMEGSNNSLNTRESQMNWALSHNHLIFFGGGIGKGEMMLESFYSLYYYRFGVFGILIYLSIPLFTSFVSFKIALKERILNLAIFYYALSVYYLITPLALLSSCHQDTPKISLLFYGLIGLVYKKYNSYKNSISS